MKTITIPKKKYLEMKSTIQKLEIVNGIRVGLLEVKEASVVPYKFADSMPKLT